MINNAFVSCARTCRWEFRRCHVRANESNTPLAMEIGLVTTDAPGQDTNGLTHRELDHEPCLPAIP
jgi:hypothetical protein